MAEIVEVLVDGGKATPGNPLGPILGPMGVNIVEIVKVINEKTAAFDGMKVPVKLRIDPKTKAFEVSVGTPPTSSLILKELGIEKGSGENRTEKVGDISLDQLKRVAAMKKDSLLGRSLKDRVLEVTGTCVSMGINVNGEDAKKAQALIKDGSW
ncbi:MAG: 50S ribosomal protein L11, partial [Thermoplasmata archaeon]|nr:50S ribosomal protein L11 [Thermoplasmata archaeon]